MGHLIGKKYSQDHVLEIAKNISLAVYKAPQITGKTEIEVEIIWGEDLEPIIEVMSAAGQLMRYIAWDAETIKRCYERGENPVIVAIGGKAAPSNLAWDCGACGFKTCKEFNSYAKDMMGGGLLGGPSCNWKALDFSIACDWACASAWQYKVDNRICGSIGFALNALGFLPGMNLMEGLELGPPRDMVYYNREDMHKDLNYEMDKQDMFNCIPNLFTAFPGGGIPMYKTKGEWWAPPEFLSIGESEEAMEAMQQVFFEQIPDIVNKYADKIQERYKGKDKK